MTNIGKVITLHRRQVIRYGVASITILLVWGVLTWVGLARGGYDLFWFTVDGGGGESSGGGYSLMGTIGQADASEAMSGGSYTLTGGFWSGSTTIPTREDHLVYLPVVFK